MRKPLLACALFVLTLGAGAQNEVSQWDRPARQPIEVRVVDGQVDVPESEVVTTENQGALIWHLVTPGYTFPDDGIVIDAVSVFRCQSAAAGRVYRCLKLRHVRGARYKYDVKVLDERTGLPLPVLDPWIQNS